MIVYDKEDAIHDLRSDGEIGGFSSIRYDGYTYYKIYDKVRRYADNEVCAIMDEDSDGDPVVKKFERWYDQELLVEYNDLYGGKHQGKVEISSRKNAV